MLSKQLRSWVFATCSFVFAATMCDASVVNFANCVQNSKYGKKEIENFNTLNKQMTGMIEDTEKEAKEISKKLEDTEYVDSLSPKAEEELKARYQTLNENLGHYQNQFYQVMQQAQSQLIQRVGSQITKASEKVAKEKKLDYVMNKEACFYYRPELDVTTQVISEMDKNFDEEAKTKKVSENSQESPKANEQADAAMPAAG